LVCSRTRAETLNHPFEYFNPTKAEGARENYCAFIYYLYFVILMPVNTAIVPASIVSEAKIGSLMISPVPGNRVVAESVAIGVAWALADPVGIGETDPRGVAVAIFWATKPEVGIGAVVGEATAAKLEAGDADGDIEYSGFQN
jgi:hypothetical protein